MQELKKTLQQLTPRVFVLSNSFIMQAHSHLYPICDSAGENINITWSPDGNSIAVGNKEDLVTFIDARTFKIRMENQFKFEVNEIEWNKASNLFFLTSGQGCIHILE